MIKEEIIIIGGGMAGCLAALLLNSHGIGVTLVEKNKIPADKKQILPPSSRTLAVMQPGIDVLKEAGIWPDLRKHACPMEIMRIIEGTEQTDFIAADLNISEFGFNIPNHVLHNTLLNKTRDTSGITLIDQAELWDYQVDDTGVTVLLDNDRELRGQLLVGADGKNSRARHIAGIDAIKTNYKQMAMTCMISHSRSHHNTSNEFHKPGGPFTTVPCPDGLTSAIVWCEREETAAEYLSFKKNEIEQKIQDLSQNLLGEITLESSLESYKISGLVARKLTAHRLVLIAEAAHVLHPIGAQGFNLSLRDIKSLTDLLGRQKKLGLDLGSLSMLKEYKSQRRSDTVSRFTGVTGWNELTATRSKGILKLRQAGMSLLDHVPALKRHAMKVGLGVKSGL